MNLNKHDWILVVGNAVFTALGTMMLSIVSLSKQHEDVQKSVHKELEDKYSFAMAEDET